MSYQPPFQLTHTMTRKVANIGELIGAWKATNQNQLVPELRRDNRIRTIQASLAVEQNTLTLEQVTAVIDSQLRRTLCRHTAGTLQLIGFDINITA